MTKRAAIAGWSYRRAQNYGRKRTSWAEVAQDVRFVLAFGGYACRHNALRNHRWRTRGDRDPLPGLAVEGSAILLKLVRTS